MNTRQLFQSHLAPTSASPIALHITRAEGNYLYSGEKKYLDLIGGISVCNLGHQHPDIIGAIHQQVDQYLHIMVYGELIQTPQVAYATRLCEVLGEGFDGVYFTNSGSEAIEAAMKLAKRTTGRRRIYGFRNDYHGSTQCALSRLGDEHWRRTYRPLLPEVYSYEYNADEVLDAIDDQVAAVIVEPVQAESGVLPARQDWLQRLSERCQSSGTLLILDEVQTGFGRTGSLFAYQRLGIRPDIIVLGKALGAGMPLGAISARDEVIRGFGSAPVLGHITTFGGHPVSCAAGLAGLEVLMSAPSLLEVSTRQTVLSAIRHPKIVEVRTHGIWGAVFFEDSETCLSACHELLEEGVFTDWFLFAPEAIRISPPLTITADELAYFVDALYRVLDRI